MKMKGTVGWDVSIYLDAESWTKILRALEKVHSSWCISHGKDCILKTDPYVTIVAGMEQSGIQRTDGA